MVPLEHRLDGPANLMRTLMRAGEALEEASF